MTTSEDQPTHPMAGNVLGHIGLHATEIDDPCGPGMHLHLTPAVMGADGHVDFGVLGVFLDMACGQAGLEQRGFLHADISVHRIGKPQGSKLFVDARIARAGKRSAVVHIDVHDDLGARVAYSVQQVRFSGEPMPTDPERFAAFRKVFLDRFDGTCTLPGPLHELLELREDGGVWRMPLTAASRNGFGGLHGGVAFALVGDAAAGAVAPSAKTTSALIRYLAPGVVGPFRAEPTAMPHVDGGAFVRVEVFDEGADDLLICLAEAHVTT